MPGIQYYGFSSEVPPLFSRNRSANSFQIDGMGVEEWTRANKGKSYNDFYQTLKDTLDDSANSIFGLGKMNTLTSLMKDKTILPIDGFITYSRSANAIDIQQVLGESAFKKWQKFAEVMDKGSEATKTRVIGFDLETFGDITNLKTKDSEFGITELAIGERVYDKAAGKAGKMIPRDQGYGSFVFGINSEQKDYLQSIINKYKTDGWDMLDRSEQVSLSRLSRYRGSFSDRFRTVMKPIFDQTNNDSKKGYLAVNKLADELLSLEAFESGLKNLVDANNHQDVYNIRETMKKFIPWFMQFVENDNAIIYGANSSFDINGLYRTLSSMSDNDFLDSNGVSLRHTYLDKLKIMEKEIVDVVYAARTAAATQGIDVGRYMESFHGILNTDATVQGQLDALLYDLTQAHEGFLDVGNEGKLADFHVNNILKLFDENTRNKFTGLTKREEMLQRIKTIGTGSEDIDFDKVMMFVRYGELDKTKGYEYAYRPFTKPQASAKKASARGQILHNYNLRGEYYKFDLEHSGIYTDKDNKKRYVFTLASAGDVITGGSDTATRIAITADSFEDLQKRMGEISKASMFFTQEDIIADQITQEDIIAQQIIKYKDDGRRQLRKLISPSDVRTVRNGSTISTYGGIKSLSDMLVVMDEIESDLKKNGITDFLSDPTTESIETYSKILLNKFGKNGKDRFGQAKIPFITGDYQLKSFMSFSATLNNERELHQFLIEKVAEIGRGKFLDGNGEPRIPKFAHGTVPDFSKLTPEEVLRLTALYQNMYEKSLEIMGSGDAKLHMLKLAGTSYVDKFGLDILDSTSDTGTFRIDLSEVQKTTNDIKKYLTRIESLSDSSKELSHALREFEDDGIIDKDTRIKTIKAFKNLSQNTTKEKGTEIHHIANMLSFNIHKNVDGEVINGKYVSHSISDSITSDWIKQYDITNKKGKVHTIGFSERFTNVRQQIETALGEIENSFNTVRYQEMGKLTDANIEALSRDILGKLNIEESEHKLNLVKEIFDASGKKYDLKNYAKKGVYSYVVFSDAPDGGVFLLHTNQANRATLQQMIDSGDYNEAFSSFAKLRNSEIAQHASIEELFHVKKYVVDDAKTTLMSVKQGENFEKFIIQTMRTWRDDEEKLRVNFDAPDEALLGLHRRAGDIAISHIVNGEFDRGTNVFRRIDNDFFKPMPSPSDVSGIDRIVSLTSKDLMHAYEHRNVDALNDIFREFVITKGNGAPMGSLNHAQQLVYQFGAVLGMDMKSYDDNFDTYAKEVMDTSQWEEFFKRRLISNVSNEPWTFRDPASQFGVQITWKDALERASFASSGGSTYNYNFDRSILTIMQEMAEANGASRDEILKKKEDHLSNLRNTLKKTKDPYVQDQIDKLNEEINRFKISQIIDENISEVTTDDIVKVLSQLPDADVIDMIGSESDVPNGAMYYGGQMVGDIKQYFARRYGDSQNFSGIYSMMRPLYHQQNSAMGYDISAIDQKLFNGLQREINGEKYTTASFGTVLMSNIEYQARKNLNVNGEEIKKETEFLARVKVLSDYSLQDRFDSLVIDKTNRKQARDAFEEIFKKFDQDFGISFTEKQYNDALEYMRRNLGSMYQDKVIAAPALMEQKVFHVNDTVKMKTNFADVDEDYTRQILKDLREQAKNSGDDRVVITRDTVLGRRAGRDLKAATDIYWDKTDAYLRVKDIDTLLNDLDTKNTDSLVHLTTVTSDVFDRKIMINGMEKGTVHTIDVSKMADDLNISKDQARWLANTFFGKLTDGAVIAMNPGIAKHGGVAGAESLWNVILENYRLANYGPEEKDKGIVIFASQLNEFLKKNKEFYPRENDTIRRSLARSGNFFKVENVNGTDRLIGDVSQLEKQSKFVERFYEEKILKIVNNPSSRSKYKGLYTKIFNEYEDLVETNSFLATAHHQIMNTHMGTHMRVDRRMEQGWQMRGINQGYTGAELEPFLKWIDQFREAAYNYTGEGTGLQGANGRHSLIEEAASFYSRSKNHGRIINKKKFEEMARGVTGLVRVLDYMDNPEAFGKTQGNNVVHISINELIGSDIEHASTGVDPGNLEASIFLTDGKPSKFLLDHAEGKNIDGMFNIMIDFGEKEGVEYTAKKGRAAGITKGYKGLLIPILTGNTFEDDKILYQNQPRELAKLVSKIRSLAQSTNMGAGDEGTEQRFLKEVLKYYNEDYANAIAKQTRIMKKDSDLYKATRTYIAPNSGEFMGQDEATPFLKKYMDWAPTSAPGDPPARKFKELLDERESLVKKLTHNPESIRNNDNVYDADIIRKYNNVEKQITSYLNQMAEEVETTLKSNHEADISQFITLDPNSPLAKVKGLAAGISEEGFERMGFDFGYVAGQIATDIEDRYAGKTSQYSYEGLDNFIKNNDVINRLKKMQNSQEYKSDIKEVIESYTGTLNKGILGIPNQDVRKQITQFAKSFSEQSKNKRHERLYNMHGNVMGDIDSIFKQMDQITNEVIKTSKRNKGKLPPTLKNSDEFLQNFRNDIYKVLRKHLKETGIAQDYMRQVGIYSEFIRFPVMRSQEMVRLMLDDTVSGAQVRVNNPILSSLSHLDFDGDKIFLAMITNGMGILKETDEAFKNAAYISSKFVQDQAPGLLAELLRNRDAVISENPNAINIQKAEMLGIIDVAKFDTGMSNYLEELKRRSIGTYNENFGEGTSIKKAIEALKSSGKTGDLAGAYNAAISSKEMAKVFDEQITNVMYDEYGRVSALVARIRKENIGHISTPAYKLRETLIEAYFNRIPEEQLSNEQIGTIGRILHGLSNMDTESGGILSTAEQKVIDPKHARDSLLIQRANLFSTGVKDLFEKGGFIDSTDQEAVKRTIAHRQEAIMNIMKAIGPKVFGYDFEDEKYAKVAQHFIFDSDASVGEKTLQKINQAIQDNDKTFSLKYNGVKVSRSVLEQFMTMRDLYQSVGQIKQLSDIYQNYVGATDYRNMIEYLSKVTAYSQDQLKKMFEYTTSLDLNAINILTRDNTMAPTFKDNVVYVHSQLAKNSAGENYVQTNKYVYHDGAFHEIIDNGAPNSSTSQNAVRYTIGDIVDLDTSQIVSPKPNTEISIGDLNIDDKIAKKSLGDFRGLENFEKTLNYYLLENNQVRESAAKLPTMRNLLQSEKFIHNINLTDSDLDNLRTYALAADYARQIKNYNVDGNASGADIIRSINKNLAENRSTIVGSKTTAGTITSSTDFVEYYKRHFAHAVTGGDEDAFQLLIDEVKNFQGNSSNFNLSEYMKQLDLLHQKAYNIGEIYNEAEASFKMLESINRNKNAIMALNKAERAALNKRIQSRKSVVNDMLENIFKRNMLDPSIAPTISLQPEMEAIYSLFSDESAMDAFFRWNGNSVDEMRVGFGEYTGIAFEDLNKSDKKAIMREAEWILDDLTNNPNNYGQYGSNFTIRFKHAVEATHSNLDKYEPSAKAYALRNIVRADRNENADLISIRQVNQGIALNTGIVNTQRASEAAQRMKQHIQDAQNIINNSGSSSGGGATRQTLHGSILDSIKDMNITGKQVGVVLGAMAGLGLVNKLLHPSHQKSPLQAGHSGVDNPPMSEPGGAPKTPGMQRTIYHDKQSGLDFKVSAKTKRMIDSNSMQGVLSRSGVNNAQVYIHNDTTGVSDNWLANKFAELAE